MPVGGIAGTISDGRAPTSECRVRQLDRAFFIGQARLDGIGQPVGIHVLECNDAFLRLVGLDCLNPSAQERPLLSGPSCIADFWQSAQAGEPRTLELRLSPDERAGVFEMVPLNEDHLLIALQSEPDPEGALPPGSDLSAGGTRDSLENSRAAGVDAAAAVHSLHAFSQSLVCESDPERIVQALRMAVCLLAGADGAAIRLHDPAAGQPAGSQILSVVSDDQPAQPVPATIHSVPLRSGSGQDMGVLEAWRRESRSFSTLELKLADLAARQAADALERLEFEKMLAQSRQSLQTLAERMRKTCQRKNNFLGVLSHELRNPLASIMMSLSLLDHTVPGGGQATKALDVLKRQTAHLSSLVDDLLDVTRITNGKVKLKPTRLELNALAARVADDYRPQYLQRGIDLQVSLASEPVRVHADSTRIIQVIGNLLQNSVKFTKPGGVTILSVAGERQESKAWAVVRVRDNGIGIRQENLSDLFEPFTQLDCDSEVSRMGLGLGLTIVKGIVELHGGQVSVFSEGENRGAEFTVRLPLLDCQTDDRQGESCTATPGPKPLRILVIDDSRDLADTICSLLEILGHVTTTAYDGLSGIAKAVEFKPDVILCDIGLPEMDGYEVARRIRSNPETDQIFLIALSGFVQQEDIERAVQAGFDQHVAKPVNIDVIQNILKRNLENVNRI